ncbi:hypothetical protein [Komagataeibacter rhaeticus]|uniref:hypothetical protein n=1 Tax=Komagataeibacter rhaeticus TaxID=215221 RepID=UPI000AE18CB6|nr:hypothetical protein [Komagataeibacter rhaeticus]
MLSDEGQPPWAHAIAMPPDEPLSALGPKLRESLHAGIGTTLRALGTPSRPDPGA